MNNTTITATEKPNTRSLPISYILIGSLIIYYFFVCIIIVSCQRYCAMRKQKKKIPIVSYTIDLRKIALIIEK